MRTVTIELDDALAAQLEKAAARSGRTLADYLRKVAEYVAPPARLYIPGPDADPLGRTDEEVAEARARILAHSRPARPLPPGKTWVDVINELPKLPEGDDSEWEFPPPPARPAAPAARSRSAEV